MPPGKKEKRNKSDKPKDKKRRRKMKKSSTEFDDVSNIEKIPSLTKSKTKSKSRTKKIRKHTLAKLIVDKPEGFPLPSNTFKEKEKLFTVRRTEDLKKKKTSLDDKGEKRRRKGHRKELQKIPFERLSSNDSNMAAGSNKGNDRGRKGMPGRKHRKKPHSLPPLDRQPTSRISTPQITNSPDTQNNRRFIGSPPPSALMKKESSGEILHHVGLNPAASTADIDSGEDAFLDEETTAYSPTPSLEQSYPKITIKMAPQTPEEGMDESPPIQENAIVSASPSERSAVSMSSLVRSTSALTLNSSLSLPPKLLSYIAEDGSQAVQEYVPEERTSSASSTRRSSVSSIRDLPSPLRGVSPLQIPRRRPPHATNLSNPKLTPLA